MIFSIGVDISSWLGLRLRVGVLGMRHGREFATVGILCTRQSLSFYSAIPSVTPVCPSDVCCSEEEELMRSSAFGVHGFVRAFVREGGQRPRDTTTSHHTHHLSQQLPCQRPTQQRQIDFARIVKTSRHNLFKKRQTATKKATMLVI